MPTPIESVGNRAIDFSPPFLKDFAVKQFGTADKPVLIGGVVGTLALLCIVAGIIGRKNPRAAIFGIAVHGVLALAAALFDRTATASRVVTMIPTVLTLGVALASFGFLLRRLGAVSGGAEPGGFERRAFLIGAFGVAVLAAIGGGVSRVFGGAAAKESRANITLPTAAEAAPAIPAGVQSDTKGVSRFITPNKDFYRIDTALSVPDVPAEGWALRLHGLGDNELSITYRDLMDMPLVERRVTLTCVSNEVGGPYVGTATWLGVLTKDLLEQAGVQSGADAVKTTSADSWTCGTPLEALTDDRSSMIAIGMNGEPLPLIHGFPARMVVPGLYGYVSATTWLTDFEVTRFADFKAYWTTREYTAEAPIKFSSRIDVPNSFQAFAKDQVRVGGVAWAQTVGIEKVEVKIDNGDWVEADLSTEDTIETWRQWSWVWDDATEGSHQLTVRATNKDGETQTSDRARIRPTARPAGTASSSASMSTTIPTQGETPCARPRRASPLPRLPRCRCSPLPAARTTARTPRRTRPRRLPPRQRLTPLLKTLTAAVSGQLNPDVDLVDTLNGGEFTVFAPVDDPFAKLPAETVKTLGSPEGAETLSSVRTYHVIPGQVAPADIDGTLKTVNGADLTVEGSDDDITVGADGAKVICGGVKTANATVYLIDSVLMPPA